jgi:MFS family permease
MSIGASDRSLFRRDRAAGYRSRIALGVMLTGVFVTVMDGSIVNVAIPSIRTTLGATFAEAELVVAGYIFIFAAFTLTSALCGFAPNSLTLIVARILQGVSASLLSP